MLPDDVRRAWADRCGLAWDESDDRVREPEKYGWPKDFEIFYAGWNSARRDVVSERPLRSGFYVASFRQSGGYLYWWGPNRAGYTPDLDNAGIYHEGDFGPDICVPVAFIDTLKVRRMVDKGDSLNGCTWDGARLTAAIKKWEASNVGR